MKKVTYEDSIKVRPDRHFRSCACESCKARQERLIAYFSGETEDRGIIPGSYTRGEKTSYKVKGRRIMGLDLVRYSESA